MQLSVKQSKILINDPTFLLVFQRGSFRTTEPFGNVEMDCEIN